MPPTLARTLRSTNTIESMISICRDHAGHVKRWQDGQMALRWCAAGMVEESKQFRHVNGYLHMSALRAALEAEVANTVTGRIRIRRRCKRPDDHPGPPPTFNGTRDILVG